VAVIFTTPFVIKAIGLHTAMRQRIDGDLDTTTATLSPAGPEEAAIPANPNGASGVQPPLLPVTTPPAPHPAAGQWHAAHSATGWQGGPHAPEGVMSGGRGAMHGAGQTGQLAGNGRQPAVTGNSGDAVLEMSQRH
jgi:hypothetical protein